MKLHFVVRHVSNPQQSKAVKYVVAHDLPVAGHEFSVRSAEGTPALGILNKGNHPFRLRLVRSMV